MVIKDFFTFDKDEYASRISSYDTTRLCKQEIVKTRQQIAAGCQIGSGLAAAPFTFGLTLGISGIGARRTYVAAKKFKLITAELESRNVPLHQLQKRDFLIPFGASLAGLGLGFGLDEVAMAATNAIPMEVMNGPTGTSSAAHEVMNPGATVHGWASGALEQVHEMGNAAQNMITDGIVPGSDLSSAALASHTAWNCISPADAVSFHQGMLAAQGLEKAVASFIGQEFAWKMMEALLGMEQARQSLPCSRLAGLPVSCDSCRVQITSGQFWREYLVRFSLVLNYGPFHTDINLDCCGCNDDYDLCRKCFSDGKRCKNKNHAMRTLQVAKNADYLLDIDLKGADYWGPVSLSTVWSKSNLAQEQYAQFICDGCNTRVAQSTQFRKLITIAP
jgi:hypothetical protein